MQWGAAHHRAPDAGMAARLTLVGMVIALQDLLELPRQLLTAPLGATLTSLVVVLALATSLGLLLVALAPRPPSWRWLRRPWVQRVVLGTLCLTALAGLHELGVVVAASVQPPTYSNDGTTLDHYAAQQLREGHNPYVTTTIFVAVRFLHQKPEYTTPLHQGVFAGLPLTHTPTPAERTAAFAAGQAGEPGAVAAFESHVSYPALAVLPLVPFVWAGLPSVVPFFALCLVALAVVLLRAVPREARLWVGLLLLADAPLLDATATGDLDVFYVLLLVVAWRYWRRPLLSAVALGLALAAKQIAWFYLPFYTILIWRERGWREALARLAGAGALFLAVNLPFFVNAPQAWLAGVLAPQLDPLFPGGSGLVRLALGGLLPLGPEALYTLAEALVLGGCIVWYWRHERRMPEAGFVLAVVPLFFAWRSLTTYFYFVAVPAVALVLARHAEQSVAGSRSVSSYGVDPSGGEARLGGALHQRVRRTPAVAGRRPRRRSGRR